MFQKEAYLDKLSAKPIPLKNVTVPLRDGTFKGRTLIYEYRVTYSYFNLRPRSPQNIRSHSSVSKKEGLTVTGIPDAATCKSLRISSSGRGPR